ncbi:MAG TPA: 2-oxo acid dehydrogenase subunit E2 [Saprospiraceae bacterium]|nr:2-oxo acid dehydrogenase subunit E2 [Saprospiraceae bacterium]
MAKVELVMPKMGESIVEATILKWLKGVGDTVELDEPILEIATDKVDSEVPSPVAGTIAEILFEEDTVVEIGKVIAVIATEGEEVAPEASPTVVEMPKEESNGKAAIQEPAVAVASDSTPAVATISSNGDRFYSPLVRSISKAEGVTEAELSRIPGTGLNNRVTKTDILNYIKSDRKSTSSTPHVHTPSPSAQVASSAPVQTSASGNVEIIEMDRMRKLIAKHMVQSWHTSPHVTSYIEVDVTNIVKWRTKNKDLFVERYGDKITFTPIFIQATVKALLDHPMINISVEGEKLLVKKDINIGMAAALPDGNLIVPVIKNADQLSLPGLAKQVNDLAQRARANKLKPDEIQGGTFTVTNVGTFGNVMGTPIIPQPQVAILALGAIRKKPAVLETEYGDVIAIRHMMFLSLSYDHRVVDGSLGGSMLNTLKTYMEAFDPNQGI